MSDDYRQFLRAELDRWRSENPRTARSLSWIDQGLAVARPALTVTLAVSGWLVADGLYRVRAADRYVTVKGLSEREVPADLALWPLTFSVTADDLTTLQARIDASAKAVQAFLAPTFPSDAVEVSVPRITDRQGHGVGPGAQPLERYLAETTNCRGQALLAYFGEHLSKRCGHCDNCADGSVDAIADPEAEPYPVHSTVRHPEWGDGMVLRYEADRMTVLFDEVGYKTLSVPVVVEQRLLTAGQV